MSNIGEIKECLDKYLTTRDNKYLSDILEKVEYIVLASTKNVLKNYDIDSSKIDEYTGFAYSELIEKISKLEECDKKPSDLYKYLYTLVSHEVERQVKIEKEIAENNISFSDLKDRLEELERYGLVDTSLEDIEKEIDLKNKKIAVSKLLARLSDRHREIIRLYYGFDDGKQKSLQEVADIMGLHRGYVFYVVSHSLSKMREYIYRRDNKKLRNTLLK